MKPIDRIAIVGAGAMGAAYASLIKKNSNIKVCFAARGERYDRLNGALIRVNGEEFDIPVVHPARVDRPFDLILVALKHHHLTLSVLGDIKAMAGEDTLILSVMNGLESEGLIGEVCGPQKLMPAIAIGIDAVHENGCFTFANPGKIIFGKTPSPPKCGGTSQMARLRKTLEQCGIPCEISQDILRTMWWKFMVNVGVNQASAVLKAPYGIFQTSDEARNLMVMLMEEVVTLAQHRGINLQVSDIDQWVEVLSALSPTGKTSMLQDMEAGRKTEVEIFAGSVVAMGRQAGIPTPINNTLFHLIRVMESQGAG